MKYVFLAVLSILAGCASIPSPAEVEQAESHVFPNYKFTRDRKLPFTPAERQKAIRESKILRAQALYELLIDHEGKVVETSVARQWSADPDGTLTLRFLGFVKATKFKPDYVPGRYRATYYPMNLRGEIERFP